MNVTKRKPDSVSDREIPEQLLSPVWSQVASKSVLSQNGIPLPGSAQHPLWIQPVSRRFSRLDAVIFPIHFLQGQVSDSF